MIVQSVVTIFAASKRKGNQKIFNFDQADCLDKDTTCTHTQPTY